MQDRCCRYSDKGYSMVGMERHTVGITLGRYGNHGRPVALGVDTNHMSEIEAAVDVAVIGVNSPYQCL